MSCMSVQRDACWPRSEVGWPQLLGLLCEPLESTQQLGMAAALSVFRWPSFT